MVRTLARSMSIGGIATFHQREEAARTEWGFFPSQSLLPTTLSLRPICLI